MSLGHSFPHQSEDAIVRVMEQCALNCFDHGYINRLRNRDAETEAHFIAHFRTPIWLKARRSLRYPDLVADAYQETQLRVLQYLRSGKCLDYPERFPAFVSSVCHNVLLEMMRSRSRYAQIAVEDRTPAGPWGDPHLNLITKERKQLVREILAQLSEKDRELLSLIFGGMDRVELCRRFGVNETYLRVLLHRATVHFKKVLGTMAGAPLNEQRRLAGSGYPGRVNGRSSPGMVTPSSVAGLRPIPG